MTNCSQREWQRWGGRLFLACLMCSAALPAFAAEKAAKYALLVGVAKYEHAAMNSSPLKFPEDDAKSVGELLRASGYTVRLLVGRAASRKAILAELQEVARQGTQDGAVVVGLFGHGVQYGDNAFFGPFDTTVRTTKDETGQVLRDNRGQPKLEPDPQTMVGMRAILDALTACGAGNRLLLADCCRQDPAAARGRAFGSRLRVADLPPGTAALFACSASEQAFEHDDWQHGAFTKALLDECRKSTELTANELAAAVFRSVRKMVREKTNGRSRQTVNPLVNGIVELKLGVVDVLTSSIGMKLKLIPAGEFLMGSGASSAAVARRFNSSAEVFSDEFPQHRVRITKPFYLGIHEVTQAQWREVMGTAPWKDRPAVREGDDFAATFLSWQDATDFCRQLSRQDGAEYRLPTEAEWEYACRAGSTTTYSFGDSLTQLNEYAWYEENAWKAKQRFAHPVGGKLPNRWGLHDMHGNVWEWCGDWYDVDYYKQFRSGAVIDPRGPSSGATFRVFRGGSWSASAATCRSANRNRDRPELRNSSLGFRVVRIP